jgi:hypothetical protein
MIAMSDKRQFVASIGNPSAEKIGLHEKYALLR